MIGVSSCDLLVAGLVADDDALILRLRLVVGGGHFVIIVIIRRLRGRVFGGHRGGQVGALRLEAVGVGHVDHLVDNTVGTGVAELTVDIIALLVAVSLHRLARLRGVDAVLSLETVNGVKNIEANPLHINIFLSWLFSGVNSIQHTYYISKDKKINIFVSGKAEHLGIR